MKREGEGRAHLNGPIGRVVLLDLNLIALSFALLVPLSGFGWSVFSDGAIAIRTLPAVWDGLTSSRWLLFDALGFLLAYIGLHLFVGTAWYALWLPVSKLMPLEPVRQRRLAWLSFAVALLAVLILNGILNPRSEFALSYYLPDSHLRVATCFSILYLLGVPIVALGVGARALLRRRKLAPALTPLAIVALIFFAVTPPLAIEKESRRNAGTEHPDVIIIGVDGVRLDHVGFLMGHEESITPALDDLLRNAAVFGDAWTPLARTYPSWVSILTGLYPSSHGAIFNLVPANVEARAGAFTHYLGELGYERIYAIDETRFSNMDETYGFDRVVAPAIGAFDFMGVLVGDLPLVNLVSNGRAGKLLFPYVYMNRALDVVYRPRAFDREVARALNSVPSERPLLLAVHYELAHWPYTWARFEDPEVPTAEALARLSSRDYVASIARVDAQVETLMATLHRRGFLRNAVVVLLSDHGEAFAHSEPRRSSVGETAVSLPRAYGHGTNVLSEAQHRVLLAFRGFGLQEGVNAAGLVREVSASLVDVGPTLSDWLDWPAGGSLEQDGESLMELVRAPSAPPPPQLLARVLTLETGVSTEAIKTGIPDKAKAFYGAAHYYAVVGRGRLVMQEPWLSMLRGIKQRAVVSGDWLLAVMPTSAGEEPDLVLVRTGSSEYWDLRSSGKLPPEAPVELLMREARERFSADLVLSEWD